MLTRDRLRTFRTLFVHRWHAAQTIGERFGNDAVGDRFEHINHARSLAEYVWRYGVFEENAAGTGRVPLPDTPYSLRDIVAPVAAKGEAHLRAAARYAVVVLRGGVPDRGNPVGGTKAPNGGEAEGSALSVDLALRRYAELHPDVKVFAAGLISLHRAMLHNYVQMRYLTPAEAEHYRTNTVPLFLPLARTNNSSRIREATDDAGQISDDVVGALRGAFARNIHNALACRARAELLETVVRHEDGETIATEATGAETEAALTTTAIVQRRRRRFVIHDDALAAMLQSLDEAPLPPLVRWLAAFKAAVSTMITAMPMFIVKNFFRDTLAGFVAGRYWQTPVLGTLAGSVHAIHDLLTGRSDAMREYLLQGGFYSALVESETHVGDVRESGSRGRGFAGRWGARVVYLLTRPAWIAEAGTRITQFRTARRRGATGYAASRAARMVSADFANIGASRTWRMYVHTVPFMNAAIQGFDQLYQIIRPRARARPMQRVWSREQAGHVTKTLLAGCLLGVLTWTAWNYNTSDDERLAAYLAETEYEKASWLTLYDIDGYTDVRIPVPFQIGAAFMKLPEVTLDLVYDTQTLAGPKFAWSLVHGNLAIGWIPAVAQPYVEVRTNRNFFGDEIVPAYMRNWPAERQYFHRSTPEPYRMLGAALGVSPLHVQTFVRGWTGHLGNAVVTWLDEAMWNKSRDGPKPFPRATGLLTGLASLQPPQLRTYTRYSNEFYDLADWADGHVRSTRRPARPAREARLAQRLTARARRQASHFRRRADEIRTNPALSRQQKEQGIAAEYERIDVLFQQVLPRVRAWREQWQHRVRGE